MSPHRRHQVAVIAPWIAVALGIAGAIVSVAGAVWVGPKMREAAAVEQQKALEEFKTSTRQQIGDLERARQQDHELLIQIANDMGWVRRALEKTAP